VIQNSLTLICRARKVQ